MRTATAMLGTRPGGRTFVLLMLRNERMREAFRAMVKGMQDRQAMPAGAFAIASDLSGHGGEILLVIPPDDNVGEILRSLNAESAMRLSLQLARGNMSMTDYAAYNALAEAVLADRRGSDD